MPNVPEIPRLVRLELAGECVRCSHFYVERAEYTMACRRCSRFYGDLFVAKVDDVIDKDTKA